MADKKGITVKIDADLHAEISRYIQENGMTMTEFVIKALDDELHPKIQNREDTSMEKTRTIAFQVPEELYQRIKDYLQRNGMTQKQFFMELIEDALDQEQNEREGWGEDDDDDPEPDEDDLDEDEDNPEQGEYPSEAELDAVFGDDEGGTEQDTYPDEDDPEAAPDDEESEDEGFTMDMV